MVKSIADYMALGVLCLMLLLWSKLIIASDHMVGVLTPDVREPFKTIFDTIEQGVNEEFRGKIRTYKLSENFTSSELQQWIKEQDIGPVVALGVLGQQAALALPKPRPVVLGALLNAPNDEPEFPGVALTPDPGALFALLNELAPDIHKVAIVYNPDRNEWLVNVARQIADKQKLTLITRSVSDLKQAANEYKSLLDHSDFGRMAIWLLQDPSVVDSKVVLPFILQEAWSKNIVVFSSALAHVKKGVLFSMYPDNKMHGQQIGRLLKAEIRNSNGKRIYPSTELLQAINSRTAEHLGMRLRRPDLSAFDVVFPISN